MATRNFVPRDDNDGSIGVTSKKWGNGYFYNLNIGPLQIASTTATPTSDDIYSLGSETLRFSEVNAVELKGVATSALYADLAEKYTIKGTNHPIGSVVNICEDPLFECEITDEDCSINVIGVVAKEPAIKMNAGGKGKFITLKGKTPVRVIGAVKKGDVLVSAGNGCARAITDLGELVARIGVAMESNYDSNEKLVMCAI